MREGSMNRTRKAQYRCPAATCVVSLQQQERTTGMTVSCIEDRNALGGVLSRMKD
jgi:hypothetical protein